MDLNQFKEQFICEQLQITEDYGKIFSFIDFGNVNNWFRDDTKDIDDNLLSSEEFLTIDLEKLYDFLNIFSSDIRFYYGHNPENEKSMNFLFKTKHVYGKSRTFTKPIQWVRHYLTDEEMDSNTRSLFSDNDGFFVKLPKCNFDVEIAVDSIKLLEKYDTFCILSGDSDFVYLNNFVRARKKKVILIKGGHITSQLRKSADLRINAQNIKRYIVSTMQKPGG